MARIKPKRESLMNKVMNEVVIYGGFPVRYGTMVRHLDEVAKSVDKKNFMRIRDAGLMGHRQWEANHPEWKSSNLPTDVMPLTYEELEEVLELPSGSAVPEHIWRKWITMYPVGMRPTSPIPTRRKPSGRARRAKKTTAQSGIRGVR